MVNKHTALFHHFLKMAVAQWTRRAPTDANQNDVDWEAHLFGSQHRVSSLFSQSAQHRRASCLTVNATREYWQHTKRLVKFNWRMQMIGKIGLEEHFAMPETLQDSAGFVPGEYWKELSGRLLDIHEGRLREMDENGMEMMILSLNSPAVQAIPSAQRPTKLPSVPTIFWPSRWPGGRRAFRLLRRYRYRTPTWRHWRWNDASSSLALRARL